MKTKRYHKFLVCLPNGEWEDWKVPSMFTAQDVAYHRPHSDIYTFVPDGMHVMAEQGFINGPCWAKWEDKKRFFIKLSDDPRNLPEKLLAAI
jgi:hypothetical protein